jgi:hypothetical protein
MGHYIVTPSRETQAPNKLAHAEETSLNETERASLRLFVARLGVGIADDTSLFSSMERNRLLFLRWLEMHDKLSS